MVASQWFLVNGCWSMVSGSDVGQPSLVAFSFSLYFLLPLLLSLKTSLTLIKETNLIDLLHFRSSNVHNPPGRNRQDGLGSS